MPILDFIKNRQSQQQSTEQQPKPETAKEMYTREASQDKAAAKPVQQISADDKARVSEIRTDMQKATQSIGPESPSPDPNGGGTSPQAMRQNMSNQDKVAPALSPTSEQAGTSSIEQEPPAPSPSKTPDRSQTIARPQPSWER
jgi:hypothetical protein